MSSKQAAAAAAAGCAFDRASKMRSRCNNMHMRLGGTGQHAGRRGGWDKERENGRERGEKRPLAVKKRKKEVTPAPTGRAGCVCFCIWIANTLYRPTGG